MLVPPLPYISAGLSPACRRRFICAEGKAERYGCFSIQLYMVPGANDAKYPIENDRPIVDGSIFIGSFHVSGIEGKRR